MPPSNNQERKRGGSLEASGLWPPWPRRRQQGHRATVTLNDPANRSKGWSFLWSASWAWSRVSFPSYRFWGSLRPGGGSGALYGGYEPAPRSGPVPLPASEKAAWGGCASRRCRRCFSRTAAELIQATIPQSGARPIRREQRLDRLTRSNSRGQQRVPAGGSPHPGQCGCGGVRPARKPWAIGRSIRHASFATADSPTLFRYGEKISIAVKFEGMPEDPRPAPWHRLSPLP